MTKKFFLAMLMSCFALFASASNYLTFTAEEDNSSFYIKNVDGNNPNVEYSLDDGETWTILKDGQIVRMGKKGDNVLLRGYNPNGFGGVRFNGEPTYTEFLMSGKIAASGSVMSLIDGIGESKTIPSKYCFYALFMNCTSLTQAPELPATTLADYCYGYMFYDCTSLVQAPELPATTLADYCYGYMFYGCTSLIQAPELPATTLTHNCYWGMFETCTSLIQAPELPATTLADNCYYHMFFACTSLIQAPELPATTLADKCYYDMFLRCTSLIQAPELPATTLTDYCYNGMFMNCTSLVQAPKLPATTLADNCYESMFQGCTSLVQAPELPATTLADYCYIWMFYGCTSLTQAPELPAKTLANNCYGNMFLNCEKIQKIKVGFDIWSGKSTYSWVGSVAPTGTFYCPKELPIEYGDSRIPEGWNVEYIDEGTDIAEHVSDASFKAWGADGKITYIGATMPVEIYDINGRLVKKMNEKSQSVDVPQHGIYVVKSGNVSLKVEL